MNFTSAIRPPKDFTFGFKKNDGTWTGMIGALQRREIDVGKNSSLSNPKMYLDFYVFFSPTSNGNACRTSRSDFFLSTSRLRSVRTLCQKSQRRRELHCIHRISAFCVLDLYCNIWLFSSIISIRYK